MLTLRTQLFVLCAVLTSATTNQDGSPARSRSRSPRAPPTRVLRCNGTCSTTASEREAGEEAAYPIVHGRDLTAPTERISTANGDKLDAIIRKIDELYPKETASTMERISWHPYFLAMAKLVSTRSNCHKLKVGAVLVNQQNRVIGTGYNGFMAGAPHTSVPDKDKREIATIHAEMNCLLGATAAGQKVDGATIYVTHYPCVNCAKHILQSGVKRIIYLNEHYSPRDQKMTEGKAAKSEMRRDRYGTLYCHEITAEQPPQPKGGPDCREAATETWCRERRVDLLSVDDLKETL